MEGKPRSRPSFFKVLFNEDFNRQLRLPTAFVLKHGEVLHEKAILRASSGKSWLVKLEHFEEYANCYFTLGWPKFTEDLRLRTGEFLVFWFAGKSTFDVVVYGISGCERQISKCRSEFDESSDSDEEVQILSNHNAFAKRGQHMSNKRAKTSILEKQATSCPGNVDPLSPLYFEKVLKKHQRSRMTLPVEFAKMSGLLGQGRVVLEYLPKHHFASAMLYQRPGRLDMAWLGFIRENGLVFGRTYSFKFDPRKNMIQVDEIKK